MKRKAGSVVVIVALVVLVGTAVPGTVGGARTAPLGGDAPSSATAVAASQAQDGNATNATDGTTAETGTNSTGNATLGGQISSFMSASSADVENEVESGMFREKWDRSDASQRSRLVHQRTTEIADRIEELHEEREELLAAEDLTPRERARAAWLAAQAHSLERSVDQMSEAADRANVNVDRTELGKLRQNARNLTDGEIDELTTGMVDHERGPPDDAGPPGDDEHGPPDDAGPPDERGPQKKVDDDTNRTSGSGNDGPPGKDDAGDDEKDKGSGKAKDEKDKGSGNGSGSGNEDSPGGSDTAGGKSGGGDAPGRNSGSGNDDPPGKDDGGKGNSDGGKGNSTNNGNGTSNGNAGTSNGPDGDSGRRN